MFDEVYQGLHCRKCLEIPSDDVSRLYSVQLSDGDVYREATWEEYSISQCQGLYHLKHRDLPCIVLNFTMGTLACAIACTLLAIPLFLMT